MDVEKMNCSKPHHGRNIKRLRDLLGIKQETMALELDITQQAVSKLEQKEEIDSDTLVKVANIMHIPVEAIKNFNEEATVSFIANTFNEGSIGNQSNYYCTFNPIDKIVELYERMLKMTDEKK